MGSVVYRQRHGKIGLGFLLEASRNDGSEVFSTQGKLQSYNQKGGGDEAWSNGESGYVLQSLVGLAEMHRT